MPSNNPFSEPDDSDRTQIIRPLSGGRARGAASPAASAPPPGQPAPSPTAVSGPDEAIQVGRSPLLAAAAPLLQLLSRLRNTLSQPDSGALRERAVSEVRRFEQVSRDSGVPIAQLRPAHYALCASLDDVVQATPWGSEGAWASRPLVSTFHQEVRSGDRFFDVLNQVKQNPGLFLPVLELMYLCLSLGFQGRYRLLPRGPAELDRMREDVYGIIARQRPKPDLELSPHWRGVMAPYRAARAELPVWVVGAAGLVVICGMYAWTLFGLNDGSDALYARTMAAPPAQMPAIVRAAPAQPPAPAPPPVPHLEPAQGWQRPVPPEDTRQHASPQAEPESPIASPPLITALPSPRQPNAASEPPDLSRPLQAPSLARAPPRSPPVVALERSRQSGPLVAPLEAVPLAPYSQFHPTRIFAGPSQYPPVLFKAYGMSPFHPKQHPQK